MIKWIEDHEFAGAMKRRWFDVLLYQARLHPRHARVIDYWHDWEAEWEKHSSSEYPPFAQWKKAGAMTSPGSGLATLPAGFG